MRRAAMDAASKSVVGVGKGLGKGLFNLGSFAVQQLTKDNSKKDKKENNEEM